MDILLVRHAIAFDRDPDQWPNDSDRPLTPEGEARFREIARGLRTLLPSIELVLASPYARAWRTAELLAEESGWPAPVPTDALEAERSPADAMEVLRSQAGTGSLALVGHEPNLSELASLLLTGSERRLRLEMKKGGLAYLAVDVGLGPGRGLLRWLAPPKMLRAIAP
jgi:phosphohistidine phosphatase